MEISDNLKGVLTSIKDALGDYCDIKESIGISDVLEASDDLSKVVGFIKGIDSIRQKALVKSLLKGLNWDIKVEDSEFEKLQKYVSDEKKAEFILNSLSKVLESKSQKACIIMGYIINNLVNNLDTLSSSYIVCADTLQNLFDHDIENFQFICDYMDGKVTVKEKIIKPKRTLERGQNFNKAIEELQLDKDSIVLTIEKLVSHQILMKDYEVNGNADIDDGTGNINGYVEEYYSRSSAGDLLIGYIRRIWS